ncbi:MAG: hypothetical protein ACRER2_00650 [Methylococcales bacterium]
MSNVTVDDQGITTSPDPLVSGVTLTRPADPSDPTEAEGACASYSGSYFPSAALDFDGVETKDPNKETNQGLQTPPYGTLIPCNTASQALE